MGGEQSTPRALPNGQRPPCHECGKAANECTCVCAQCQAALHACLCDKPAQQDQSGVALKSQPPPPAAAATIDWSTQVPDSANWQSLCVGCGVDRNECLCKERIEVIESEIRKHTPVGKRIEQMIEFSNKLVECVPRDECASSLQSNLVERGKNLLAQHAVLVGNQKHGVITGDMMQQHLDSVAAWLTECDTLHKQLCGNQLTTADDGQFGL